MQGGQRMGFVRQYERFALEQATLYSEFPHPFTHQNARRYFLGLREIYFWGVSPGIGTCASIKDRNIGVFTFREPSRPLIGAEEPFSYAALVRDPTDEEMLTLAASYQNNACLRIAEGLSLISIAVDVAYLSADRKSIFVEV
jgi:hypothetical protein